MPSGVLQIPRDLNSGTVPALLERLLRLDPSEEILLDFSHVEWAYPSGLLPLAIGIARSRELTKICGGTIALAGPVDQAYGPVAYLRYTGFFQLAGFGIGPQPTARLPDIVNRYLPITLVARSEVEPGGELDLALVERKAQQLASLLLRHCPASEELEILAYAIREALRNVFEHSGAPEALLAAQRWSNGRSELVIADEGCGIKATLPEHKEVPNDIDLLTVAIQPGTSRVARTAEEFHSRNAGFGLFVLSELGDELGAFALASGSTSLRKSGGRTSLELTSFGGTFLSLHLNLGHSKATADLLPSIVRRGEQIANTPPSTSPSKRLRLGRE